ncbi:hypothetical protein DMA15_12735 [Streptomyces sp. WAC 01529]|uniref:hypothetical protein n=1 Tax=Streptomyces sp. WAC 01529 TaxID=2203205 RepID=UPI000F704A1F|nr:hypothetical protein [Streptomyces sp. WAC 01529]AZM53342.1 hypothetical protein DMA15_12735 [Streptomyces sp. WAC 01529]
MATVGRAKLRIPSGADAPVGPGALYELGEDVDPHLIQHVADQAERDATFADAPLHTFVSAEDGSLWVKTSATANTWATIYEPLPAWRPLELLGGYQEDTYTPQVRRIGKQVWLRGRIARTDGTVIPNGGIGIAKVPADCIPQEEIGAYAGTSSLAGDVVIGTGKVEILDVGTASSLGNPGTVLWWSQDGATAAGTPWVNVSGSYWID